MRALGLLALVGCLVGALSLAHCETVVRLCDFEGQPAVSRVGEGLNDASQVTVSQEQAHSGTWSAKLAYTFAVQAGRNYVGLATKATLPGTPSIFGLWVYGDGAGNPLRLRLRDASGETFQYDLTVVDWTGWREVRSALNRPAVFWGGDADGKWKLPLSLDSVLLDNLHKAQQGVLYMDDLFCVSDVRPVELLSMSLDCGAFGGIYWEGGNEAPPRLLLANPSSLSALEGSAVLEVLGAGDRLLQEEAISLRLEPGAVQAQAIAWPPPVEGLVRVRVRAQIGPDGTSFERTCAYLKPHDSALNAASPFGANTHFGQRKGDVPRTFDLMSKAGIKWLRDEITWSACEPTKGQIRIPEWADLYMEQAVAHGVTPLILFDYGNRFYDDGLSPTSDEAQQGFARYCYALVSHFKHLCKHWEVYNEPNIGFWKPKPDPEAYARLLRVAYTAAKKADPTCTVVGVCTAGTDLRYIEEVLKRDGMRYMDALSIHPYRYPRSPEESGFVAQVTAAHELMARYGGGDKKLWLTEIGWPTQLDKRGVTEEVSGNYLVRMYVQALSLPFVERVIWYDMQNDGTDVTYNENNFGLIRWQSFAPKQNYIAYKMLSEKLTGAKFVRRLLPANEADRRYCYEFERGGQKVLVAWNAGGAGTLGLDLDAKQAELLWADGRRELRNPVDGKLTVALTDMPVFISGALGKIKLIAAGLVVQVASPLARGERGELRVVGAGTGGVELTVTPALERLAPSLRLPGVYWFRVPEDAAPGPVSIVARQSNAAGREIASAGATVTVGDAYRLAFDAPQVGAAGTVQVPLLMWPLRPGDLRTPALIPQPAGTRDVQVGAATPPKSLGEPWSAPLTVAGGEPGPGLARPVEVAARVTGGPMVYARLDLGLWSVPRAMKPPTLDGLAAEWANVPAAKVGGQPSDLYALEGFSFEGPEDLSASVRLQWDADALYVLVQATDDRHVQAHHGAEVWMSDNVQFAVDPQMAGWKARVRGQQRAYAEIGLSRTDKGDEVYRWLLNERALAPGLLKTSRDGNVTTYEAAIPWAELGCAPPRWGDTAGFALLVNDDDGAGRKGWVRVYEGIGVGKDPTRFGVLRFV
jgi:hypothetical protein